MKEIFKQCPNISYHFLLLAVALESPLRKEQEIYPSSSRNHHDHSNKEIQNPPRRPTIKRRATIVRQSFREYLDAYSSSFTVHGLSFLLTRKPLEKVFWALCMVVVLGIAILVIVTYTIRYRKYEVRTEIRYIENDTITLPVITLCHRQSLLDSYYCYQNKSIRDSNKNCTNEMKQNSSHIRHYEKIEGLNKFLGRNCHAFNINGSLAVSGKTEFIELEYYYYGPYRYGDLYMILQSPEEFAASNVAGHRTYINSYHRPNVWQAYDVFIEKTKISRKESPFPSNCTNKHASPNLFSSIYTKKSCQEKCAMDYMYKECRDVVDVWKPFLDKKEQPFKNSTKYKSREDCLDKIIWQITKRVPGNCTCPLSCDETVFQSNLEWVERRDYGTKLFLYYKTKKVTSINEVEDYPIQDLLGSLGGILGLCIGMSVISFIEIIVYLVFLTLNLII